MEFKSQFRFPVADFNIQARDMIGLVGSCFSENISHKLHELDFTTWHNPLGTLYNPNSIAKIIRTGIEINEQGIPGLQNEEFFEHKGLAFSINYPFRWTPDTAGQKDSAGKLEQIILALHQQLLSTSFLFITWGTAIIYRVKESGLIAGNCHKLPAALFNKERLTVAEIVDDYTALIKRLRQQAGQLRIILTVSPVRHWRDGFIENQESKAILLLAKSELCRLFPNVVSYFPSYEIMMDELRDYRFYEKDLYHPNSLAIDYIFERFSDTFFTADTLKKNKLIGQFKKSLLHKIQYQHAPEYVDFKNNLRNQANTLDTLNNSNYYAALAEKFINDHR